MSVRLLLLALVPSLLPLHAVETKITPIGRNEVMVSNSFGEDPGEPKLLDLTGTHTINLPPGAKFRHLELAVELRQSESGELEVASASLFFQFQGGHPDKVVLKPHHRRGLGGGRLLADRTMRLWLSGIGISDAHGYNVSEAGIELGGKVSVKSGANAQLDLQASGRITVVDARALRRRFSMDPVDVRSPRLLRSFEIFTQLQKSGKRYELLEGWVGTISGNKQNILGYFPSIVSMRGKPDMGLSSPRLQVGNSSDWLQFEMNSDFAITGLTGKVGGLDVSYSSP